MLLGSLQGIQSLATLCVVQCPQGKQWTDSQARGVLRQIPWRHFCNSASRLTVITVVPLVWEGDGLGGSCCPSKHPIPRSHK